MEAAAEAGVGVEIAVGDQADGRLEVGAFFLRGVLEAEGAGIDPVFVDADGTVAEAAGVGEQAGEAGRHFFDRSHAAVRGAAAAGAVGLYVELHVPDQHGGLLAMGILRGGSVRRAPT